MCLLWLGLSLEPLSVSYFLFLSRQSDVHPHTLWHLRQPLLALTWPLHCTSTHPAPFQVTHHASCHWAWRWTAHPNLLYGKSRLLATKSIYWNRLWPHCSVNNNWMEQKPASNHQISLRSNDVVQHWNKESWICRYTFKNSSTPINFCPCCLGVWCVSRVFLFSC